MKGRVHSIETFGTVDGPGIRFVLFLQGCPLRCLYCHNPDTWSSDGGTLYESDDIVKMVTKYKSYYGGSGAITVTGGEPLLQIDFLIDLFSKCKTEGIHTCIDTSGILFNKSDIDKYQELLKVTDLVLLDIKQIDDKKHKVLTGSSNSNVLAFLDFLESNKQDTWIRYVLVPGYTSDTKDLEDLNNRLKKHSCISKIDILPYHRMGEVKYEALGIEYPLKDIKEPSAKMVKDAAEIVKGGISNE